VAHDFYIVLAAFDHEKNVATFSAHVNPLVRWLWIGGWVMAVGTLLALIPLTRESRPAASASRRNDFHINSKKSTRVSHVTVS